MAMKKVNEYLTKIKFKNRSRKRIEYGLLFRHGAIAGDIGINGF